MKSRFMFAALILFATSAAHAWDCSVPSNWYLNAPGNECYHNGPRPTPPSDPQRQGQHQGQWQAQGQQQSATGGQGGAGGSGGLGGAGGDAQGGSASALGGAGGNSVASGGQGGQGGNASATGSQQSQTADNAGNSQSSVYTSPRQPVMTAVAGFGETTAKCRYTNGAGVQTWPVGASFGISFKDKDCELIALSTLAYSRGQSMAGDRLLCAVTSVKKALGGDCLALVNELQPLPPRPVSDVPAVKAPPVDYVTKEELDRLVKKGLIK